LSFLSRLLSLAVISIGHKNFRFAVPQNDPMYVRMFSHIQPLLEQKGYEISVVYTERNVEANRLVAEGQADLAFVNDVSSHIGEELGQKSELLRTVVPLAHRALLAFPGMHLPPRALSVRSLRTRPLV